MKLDPKKADITLVRTMVSVRATLAQRTDVDKEFVLDAVCLGYLKRSLHGVNVFVPFNLVSVFPGKDQLDCLVVTANAIVLGRGHPICISGSSTFLGRDIPVADLDFCEYFPAPVASMPALIAKRVGAEVGKLLVRVKWNGAAPLVAPFSELQEILEKLADDSVTFVKLDFVWSVPTFGMMPTTSMILKTRKDFSGPALSRSHVHQEAVVSRGQPPRNVFGPVEISGYLTFLRSEVTKYAEKAEKDGSAASLKAMKRALSFLLMIGADQNDDLRDELEGLISDLVTPAVGGIVVEQRIEELDTLEQDAAVEVRPSLRQEIAAIRSEFQHYMLEEDEKTLVLAGASQAASALKDMIEELFAAVGH